METGTIRNLQRLIARAGEHPALQQKLREHLEESRNQADTLEGYLKRMGASPSTLKEAAIRAAGLIEPYLVGVASDDMPKHCLAAHAWEHFEIASYRILKAAASTLGMHDLEQTCGSFLEQEQSMADFLLELMPDVTRKHLQTLPQ